MKPTILLTGKTGQLGAELNRVLPIVGNLIATERKELDVREPWQIREIIRNTKPQIIVNAAAYTAVDVAETDEANARAINAEGPRFLAEEAKELGALLVHFSTDYVFDGCKNSPYCETDSTNPLNAYGRTKLAGEEAIRNSGAAHLIFRTSWVYATHGKNFLRTILRLATEREELRVVDDQIGAPTCALDLAEATISVLTRILAASKPDAAYGDTAETCHMTAAGQTTWYKFAEAILREITSVQVDLPWLVATTNGRRIVAQSLLPVSTEEFHSPTRRPAYSVLSNERLIQKFGVKLPNWRIQLQRCFSPERHQHPCTA